MGEGLKRTALALLVIAGVVATIANIALPLWRWLMIAAIMLVGMILSAWILKEQPMEFFDNFKEWRKAKLSAVLIVVEAIALIAAFVNAVQTVQTFTK